MTDETAAPTPHPEAQPDRVVVLLSQWLLDHSGEEYPDYHVSRPAAQDAVDFVRLEISPRPVSQGTEDSPDVREPEWFARVREGLVLTAHHAGYSETDLAGLPEHVRSLVEQLRQTWAVLDHNRKIRVRVEEILDEELGTETTDETQHGYVANIGVVVDRLRQARADLETRTRERDEARAAERRMLDQREEWWRHFLGQHRAYSAMLRGMARRVGDVRQDWLNRVRLDWHCHNHDCHRGHASDYVGSYSVCLDCSTEDREVIWYRCDDNSPTPAQVRTSVAKFDERISDLQAEYARHYESWERQRVRLTGELTEARAHGRLVQDEADRLSEEYARADGETTLALRRLGETEAQRDGAVARWIRDSRNVRERLDFLEARLASAVVLPEDWEQWIYDVLTSGETVISCAADGLQVEMDGAVAAVRDLIKSWRAAPVEAETPAPLAERLAEAAMSEAERIEREAERPASDHHPMRDVLCRRCDVYAAYCPCLHPDLSEADTLTVSRWMAEQRAGRVSDSESPIASPGTGTEAE